MGFKSFADKTIVQFEPGVTAVVGPNGSGKSNISDAIRWVLGEQSAKNLRGGKMEDIIFSGTSTRKPLNFAEVTLVLDNSCQGIPIDFEEISVTRRVYRTGESEYLINRQKVRLKDVVDLMLDTGIGHDSLSIISQDKVKAIVETRVEDRRVIIEEAAGVLKYKNRKKEATRKLLLTHDHLNRVQDIIFELEDQVEPLRKQSEKAKKYVSMKQEANDSEISALAYDVKTLNDQLVQAKKEYRELEFQNLSITTKVGHDEGELDRLKEGKERQEQSLQQLQNELVEITESIQKVQGQRDVLKERQKNTTSNKEQLAAMREELQSRLDRSTFDSEAVVGTVLKTKERLKQKQNQLMTMTDQYQHLEENLKIRLETTRNDYFTATNELSNVKTQYLGVGEQLKQVEQQLNDIQVEKDQFKTEHEQFKMEKNEFNKRYEALQGSLQEKKSIYENSQQQIRQQQKEAELEANRYRQLIHQQDKNNNRLQWLEEAQKDFSGFNDGVKKVLKAREKKLISGIEGAIAELVSIPKEFELAMDIVLGPMMQQIVTITDESAKNAIQFLKQNRAGRATFLPLNVIKSRYLPSHIGQKLQNEDCVLGVASDLVHYNERYRQIFESLLGSIIVTKHLTAANQLAKKLNYRYRIVTVEGDVINAGGAMTGGALQRQSSHLLRQKNEIEQCRQQMLRLEEDVSQSGQFQKKLENNLEVANQGLENLYQIVERLKDRLNELNQQKVAFDYRSQTFTERIHTLEKDEAGYDEVMGRLVKLNNELADKRVLLEEQVSEKKRVIDDLESQLDQQDELKSQLLQEMTNLKVEVAKFETRLQNQQLASERLGEEMIQIRQRLNQVLEQIASNKKELSGSDDQVEQLKKAVVKMRERREQLINGIQDQRLSLAKVNQNLELLEREVREGRKMQQNLIESMNNQAVRTGKMDVELDLLIRNIEQEHEMTFDYALTNYPLKGAISEIKGRIGRLKAQMNALGEVNIGAIQAYQQIKERYDFLVAQHADLIEAKRTLEATIHEMDQEMMVKFKKTFDLVRVQYIEIFKKLFGGGHADLILTDPHDLLSTGVEMIAKPPGINLKTLNLLSGGQKALTSIALLFAILKVRTVPFCVLDEVEAALDEVNVARYANYLKLFSQETQFIVITHRKGTMENADVLYGVTMQEQGITKLVSVRMENISKYLANQPAS